MTGDSVQTLKNMHASTGRMLTACNRLIAAVALLGSLFFLMMLASLHLSQQPEKILHLQAFSFNYSEFSHLRLANRLSTGVTPVVASQVALESLKDPVWDGALAGLGLGFTLGRTIPFIGGMVGPVAGAMLGYQLDSRI